MIEVAPNLFVGAGVDYEAVKDKPDWYVISAAKEPWHRQAIGYTGRALPKDHPEYLYAYRPRHIVMNLIDANDAAYIPKTLIDLALGEIKQMEGTKTLIHCNQGKSRSPTVALLYLHRESPDYANLTYDEAAELFRQTYLDYEPAAGMAAYARQHWSD